MTIGLSRLLKHMAWANQKSIAHLQTLPKEALGAYVADSHWHVAEIMHHIVDSADFYVFRITGEFAKAPGEKIAELKAISDLELIATQAAAIDEALVSSVSLNDEKISFENYRGEQVSRWRSTILSQAIHHATEHRAQIAAALDAKGFAKLDLDEMDLWAYEINEG